MFYYRTPLCVCYGYVDDPQYNEKRLALLDDAIEARLQMLDALAYEYKWTKDSVYSLPCSERYYLLRTIRKRREESSGIDEAFKA